MVRKKQHDLCWNQISNDGLFARVKGRALEWNIATDLVNSEKTQWWNVNFMGVITASLKCKEFELSSSYSDLVAFIDGSF